ncbi:MAG: hypothetical protein WDN75_10685 [Bacteroidota bacterium]
MNVQATQFTFNPAFGGVQPAATASPQLSLPITPVARAVDANGNTDKNFASVATITNSGGLAMTNAPSVCCARLNYY